MRKTRAVRPSPQCRCECEDPEAGGRSNQGARSTDDFDSKKMRAKRRIRRIQSASNEYDVKVMHKGGASLQWQSKDGTRKQKQNQYDLNT